MNNYRKNAVRPLIEAPPIADDNNPIICAVMPMIDSVSYKAIMVGVLNVASVWANYIPSGTTREAEVAKIWASLVDMVEFDIANCVADAIQNSPQVQAALADVIVNNSTVADAVSQSVYQSQTSGTNAPDPNIPIVEYAFPATTRDETIRPDPPACDLDVLWSGCMSIVTRLDDQARTVLENAVVFTDKFDRANNFVGAIPILGGLIEDVMDNIAEVIPDMLNAFNAYSSQSTLEELACDIFELVCEECRYPSYNELYNIYAANATGGLTDLSALNVATVAAGFVTSTGAAQSIAYHTMIVMELFALYADSKFLNLYGREAIPFMAKLGEDIPSNDWELLCDGCMPPSCIEHDYTLSVGQVVSVASNANWVSGGGWRSVDVGNTVRYTIAYDFGQIVSITEFKATFRSSNLSYGTIAGDFYANVDSWVYGSGDQLIGIANFVGTNELEVVFSGVPVNGRYMYFYFDVTTNANGYVELTHSCVNFETLP